MMKSGVRLDRVAFRRGRRANAASDLSVAVFAPPLVAPFQPSMTLPYLTAKLQKLGTFAEAHEACPSASGPHPFKEER
jgi:hypothetical protein